MRRLQNIFRLGIKELRSLRRDPVLLVLVVYAFSYGIYSAATGTSSELRNATIAVVDEDHSLLSRRLTAAFLAPYFREPRKISADEIDDAMETGRDTFVLDIPPDFERDVLRGRQPQLQVNIDATAMLQAGAGAHYIQGIVSDELSKFVRRTDTTSPAAAQLNTRIKFNPNLTSAWFVSVMELVNNVTMLAMIIAGGALIREREHGTVEHLLVMPLHPYEIMLAKIWANGLVILIGAAFGLGLMVQELLGVPIAGSVPLFLAGTVLYLASATSLGILLATIARSMPQFGLLFILVVLPMIILSGGYTPLESMPEGLQRFMEAFPSTHFTRFAQAILYRGAGFDVVWPDFAAVAGIGAVFFIVALLRFRRTVTLTQ
jgi:ABC-2 type transport system permease protein